MPLDLTYAALADPTRRAILETLAQGPAPVGTLAAPFPISGPAIRRHLRVPEDAGLILNRRAGKPGSTSTTVSGPAASTGSTAS